MNDYEYTFQEDVKEKKALAASSRHKKNGSKSKKVTLPSDGMTRKQWESRNGEVTTVQMNQPMTYEEFKSIPEDLQERYLACLVDGYRVTSKLIAEMMGVDHRTLHSYIRNHGFTKIHFRKGAVKLTEEERRDWNEFLSRRDISEETVTDEEPTRLASILLAEPNSILKEFAAKHAVEEPEETNDISDEPADDSGDVSEALNISDVHLRFEGNLDISVIMSFLQFSIGEKVHGELQISFRKTENIEEGEKCESDTV